MLYGVITAAVGSCMRINGNVVANLGAVVDSTAVSVSIRTGIVNSTARTDSVGTAFDDTTDDLYTVAIVHNALLARADVAVSALLPLVLR